MNRQQAEAYDTAIPSQIGHMSAQAGSSAEVDHAGVLTIVRWRDVQEARAAVLTDDGDLVAVEMVRLYVDGLTQREVADHFDVDQSTVSRRMKTSIDAILSALNAVPTA